MPDLPNSSSFIPKRTTGTKIRQKRTRNFFLLSIISYACLIAAPTASATVYVYQMYTERQFDQIVTRLDEAISGFSEAEMARVLEFDRRLKMAERLVETHVSVVKAFTALEQTTVRNAGFRSLAIKRLDDGTLNVEGELLASNFDTALFQRGAYKAESATMATANLEDIAFSPATEAGDDEVVTFTGTFTFLSSDIAFTPNSGVSVTPADTAVTSETSTSGETDGDDIDADDSDATVTDETI